MRRTHSIRAAALLGLALLAAPAAAQQPARAAAQAPATAQTPPSTSDTLNLTLDEAVRRAIDHNPELAVVKLDTEAEAARVGESAGAFAPVLTTTLGRSSETTPPSSLLVGANGVDARDWFSSSGVRQRLPWGGGTWSATWDASRTATTNPFTSFDPSLQSGVEVAVSQPLLKDRAIDEARQQYAIAQRNHDSSELAYREAVVQTIAAVKLAYWALKATAANVAVQQRSLDLAKELVRQNQARVDAGQAPPLDLVQAQAEVATRRENVISATTAAADAEDGLRRLIMDPGDRSFWRVHLVAADEPAGGPPIPDVDTVVAKALDQRYDLARARNDLQNAQTNVRFFSNQKLPDVSLEMSYRSNGLGGTELLRSGGFPGVVTGTAGRSFGSVLNQVFGSDYPSWSVGVTLSYPLGRSYEEASYARATVEQRQEAQHLAGATLDAAQAIREAARQVRSTAERVDAARAASTLADQRLDTEQRRYEVGLGTSFLVTQAQRDLLQAQVDLLQATLDHQSARVSFEALQQAPPLGQDQTMGVSGASIVRLPVSTPQGLFRQSAGQQE
jgi:outer membrane protein TolC